MLILKKTGDDKPKYYESIEQINIAGCKAGIDRIAAFHPKHMEDVNTYDVTDMAGTLIFQVDENGSKIES